MMTSCSRPANSKVPLYTRPKVPSCTRVRQYNDDLDTASALAFSHGSVDWKYNKRMSSMRMKESSVKESININVYRSVINVLMAEFKKEASIIEAVIIIK